MNPALSVISFTLLAGCGQGLAVATALAALLGAVPVSSPFVAAAAGLAALLLMAGLIASFFHLGRPLRAWRAAAMWRTSWLSREVIVLPACIGLLLAWFVAASIDLEGPWLSPVIPVAVLVLCAVLWVCTGMIYACIRFVQEWAHPLTLWNYALIGLSSGLVLATVLAIPLAGEPLWRLLALAAVVATVVACASRVASLARNARLRPRSTLQSATGIRTRTLRQVAMGMTGGSFNTREFFHRASARGLRHVKLAAVVLGFVMPALLLLAALVTHSTALASVAFGVQALGLVAERWFFFAEARHPQNLYYQRVS